jgi:copper chaperone CopZ
MEQILHVNGMMCTHCKAAVEKALMKVSGTESAVVDLTAKTAVVTGTASYDDLAAAVVAAGFEVVQA